MMICIHFPGKQGLICIFDGSLIRFRMPSSDAYRSSSATRLSSAERRISSTAATTSATAAYSSEKSVAASSTSKQQVGITGDVGDCVNLSAFRICFMSIFIEQNLSAMTLDFFISHISPFMGSSDVCFQCVVLLMHPVSSEFAFEFVLISCHSSWRRRLRPPC